MNNLRVLRMAQLAFKQHGFTVICTLDNPREKFTATVYSDGISRAILTQDANLFVDLFIPGFTFTRDGDEEKMITAIRELAKKKRNCAVTEAVKIPLLEGESWITSYATDATANPSESFNEDHYGRVMAAKERERRTPIDE